MHDIAFIVASGIFAFFHWRERKARAFAELQVQEITSHVAKMMSEALAQKVSEVSEMSPVVNEHKNLLQFIADHPGTTVEEADQALMHLMTGINAAQFQIEELKELAASMVPEMAKLKPEITAETHAKMNHSGLLEWLRENPGKSVSDFAKCAKEEPGAV